jgi:hypothetical protein
MRINKFRRLVAQSDRMFMPDIDNTEYANFTHQIVNIKFDDPNRNDT